MRASLENRTAIAGQQLLLPCPFAGHPINSISWEKGKSACVSPSLLLLLLLRLASLL